MPFQRRKGTFVCSYLSFRDPRLKAAFRLPLVHVKVKHTDVQFRTDALVDSGATATFLPIELAEILAIELPETRQDVVGAGGVFSTFPAQIDLIEVFKGDRSFCALENANVLIPTQAGAIPHTVLGRDNLFWLHDITFREHRQHTIFREPKQ